MPACDTGRGGQQRREVEIVSTCSFRDLGCFHPGTLPPSVASEVAAERREREKAWSLSEVSETNSSLAPIYH